MNVIRIGPPSKLVWAHRRMTLAIDTQAFPKSQYHGGRGRLRATAEVGKTHNRESDLLEWWAEVGLSANGVLLFERVRGTGGTPEEAAEDAFAEVDVLAATLALELKGIGDWLPEFLLPESEEAQIVWGSRQMLLERDPEDGIYRGRRGRVKAEMLLIKVRAPTWNPSHGHSYCAEVTLAINGALWSSTGSGKTEALAAVDAFAEADQHAAVLARELEGTP